MQNRLTDVLSDKSGLFRSKVREFEANNVRFHERI